MSEIKRIRSRNKREYRIDFVDNPDPDGVPCNFCLLDKLRANMELSDLELDKKLRFCETCSSFGSMLPKKLVDYERYNQRQC